MLVDYNPWDQGSYEELAEVVAGVDADGVMLDTMTDLPEALADAVTRRKKGVVFAPELRPRDADLRHVRQSWAQWFELGDAQAPSIYRHSWLAPGHRQFAIRRWDTSRRKDIVYSFFCGSGLILWENVFGTWNPYSKEDRRLIAETAAIFDHYQELFSRGEWLPLIPTGLRGLDANRWVDAATGRAIVTLRNRTSQTLHYRVPDDAPPGLAYTAFWGETRGDLVSVEPEGVQALVLDHPDRAQRALTHFHLLSKRAMAESPKDDLRCPRPRLAMPRKAASPRGTIPEEMIESSGRQLRDGHSP